MPVKTLPENKAPRAEFKAEILQALLAGAPAAMHYAEQYGLCPTEIRTILHEALLHAIGNMRELGPDLPILARPPAGLRCKSPLELHRLLGNSPIYGQTRDC